MGFSAFAPLSYEIQDNTIKERNNKSESHKE